MSPGVLSKRVALLKERLSLDCRLTVSLVAGKPLPLLAFGKTLAAPSQAPNFPLTGGLETAAP